MSTYYVVIDQYAISKFIAKINVCTVWYGMVWYGMVWYACIGVKTNCYIAQFFSMSDLRTLRVL